MKEYLINSAKELHINLNDVKCQQFIDYYNLIIEWNKKINLTSITDFKDVVIKHFIDSLSINSVMDLNSDYSLVDVGSGAGLPGIPLKIVFPLLKITLVDSLEKRVRFLNHVIKNLGLKDITAIHTRAEEFGNSSFRESFDICVTRAVADLAVISEYCLPLVKIDGYFISYKGGNIKDELYDSEIAIEELGGSVDDVSLFTLPNSNFDRSIIKIYKESPTPKKYPRRNGMPLKKPLR